MENVINNIDLKATAADVIAKLTAFSASLTEIVAITAALEEQTDQARQGRLLDNSAAYADWSFARGINRAVNDAQRRVEAACESIADDEERHTEALDRIEDRRLVKLHMEAAKTAAPIASGVSILSAHIVLMKGKPTNLANVLYMIEGDVCEVTILRNEETAELSIKKIEYEEQAKIHGEANTYRSFFWPEMTAEDIGKTVDLKAKIFRAAKEQFDAIPRKRR